MLTTPSTHDRFSSCWLVRLASASLVLAMGACGGGGGSSPDAASFDAPPPDAPPPDATPALTIAEARARADGEIVTVEGYVTVAPGTFASATGEQGFAIQDDTVGIYVTMGEPIGLALDAHVRVTGALGEMNQLRVISAVPADVVTIPDTRTITAQTVPTGKVDEVVEGRLVKVTGLVTGPVQVDLPYGLKVFLDDGSGEVQVFVHLVGGIGIIDTTSLMINARIEVTGLAAQYLDTYEVAPRQASDLIVLP
jgi:DNA/RNA endonuclease YhcR with UshA esterase domain